MNARPDLAALEAYLPEKPPAGTLLHANENPYPPPDDVMAEFLAEAKALTLNRYPDHSARELRTALAEYNDVDPAWVWVGTGSNEILLDACLAYGGAGRTAALFTPTYSMHHRQAIIAGTAIQPVPRAEDFSIDVDAALSAIEQTAPDVVFVCSPNNPTGTLTPLDDVRTIARAAGGLVLVDEAYYEFCGVTLLAELDEFPNVIVVRTLSKAFRLAGARIGYAIAHPDTLVPMLKVRMPYGQSSLSQLAARVALRRRDAMLDRVSAIVGERDRLERELGSLAGVEVFPSHANFVLFRTRRAREIGDGLAARGILIRDFTSSIDGCLRVTAGTPAENDAFLAAISSLL
jgi:histidinol-phosphate aminotransferase